MSSRTSLCTRACAIDEPLSAVIVWPSTALLTCSSTQRASAANTSAPAPSATSWNSISIDFGSTAAASVPMLATAPSRMRTSSGVASGP